MKNTNKLLLTVITLALTLSLLAGCKRSINMDVPGNSSPSAEEQAPIVSKDDQPSSSTGQTTTENPDKLITEAEAKQKALAHANVEEKNVTFAYTEFDINDGIQVYEIEFYTNGREYDYDINAVTGAVMEYDYEAEHYSQESAVTDDTVYITEARAKEIALNNAGLKEADVTFVRANFDSDDGRMEYEIEFYKDNAEYDYEIDAITGEILSFDTDAEKYTPPVDETKYIGNEKAKQIALAKAGVAENDALGLRIELDIDDGKSKYEIEFYNNNIEYSCEIDAVSGNIIEFEADRD